MKKRTLYKLYSLGITIIIGGFLVYNYSIHNSIERAYDKLSSDLIWNQPENYILIPEYISEQCEVFNQFIIDNPVETEADFDCNSIQISTDSVEIAETKSDFFDYIFTVQDAYRQNRNQARSLLMWVLVFISLADSLLIGYIDKKNKKAEKQTDL